MSELTKIITLLKTKGIEFEAGLSESEIINIQDKFQILFPEDIKDFLMGGLPISNGFNNWRSALSDKYAYEQVVNCINYPFEGIKFDIEFNDFWLPEWGKKPIHLNGCIEIFEAQYINYPQMIPIYSHRYIPSKPVTSGNPIFSISQTDVIVYGKDLIDYFNNEFSLESGQAISFQREPKVIEFWTELTKI